jgi:hypothetical protein
MARTAGTAVAPQAFEKCIIKIDGACSIKARVYSVAID